MEEIDIFLDGDDSIPPDIESDDFDSEDDDNETSLPEFESFHVDYPNSGDSTIDVVEDIPVDVPNILPTHPALLMDFDFIPSNDLGSDLDARLSWVSKLQSVVAMLTTEAEYVAAAQASKEAVWLKMLLEELGYKQEKINLFCDNQSALYLARNPAFHSKTKHIRFQYHFVREKVEEGTVDMQKIHTDDNVVDYMTKAINCDKFT
ncbi:hypothetical protein Tco_0431103 [Tanacetum coccineum]